MFVRRQYIVAAAVTMTSLAIALIAVAWWPLLAPATTLSPGPTVFSHPTPAMNDPFQMQDMPQPEKSPAPNIAPMIPADSTGSSATCGKDEPRGPSHSTNVEDCHGP